MKTVLLSDATHRGLGPAEQNPLEMFYAWALRTGSQPGAAEEAVPNALIHHPQNTAV